MILRGFFLFALASCSFGRSVKSNAEDYAATVTASSGVITSPGYPNSYGTSDASSWKFRVPGAQSYTLTFDDMDLDKSGCWDYIVIYDDEQFTAPGDTICNQPTAPIVKHTSEITISFLTASAFAAGPRGRGFKISYQASGNVFPTIPPTDPAPVTTPAVTATPERTTLPPTPVATGAATTIRLTTLPYTPPQTNFPTNPPQGGNFPPGNQDDSQCGQPAYQPMVTGLDYIGQGQLVSYNSPRVVNGETAVPHSWPWQVSLQGSYGSAYCGGTLVRDQWVVTAAHCAALIFIGTYGSDQVGLGMHDKTLPESSRQLIDVVAVYVHPQYDNPDRSHDVAMVKMATPAILNDQVSLACEAHEGWEFPPGMECVVTGWGVTVEGGNRGTNILQQAPLPLMSDQDCYDLYQQAGLDTTSDMQCAGGVGQGACNGDSGGPLNCYVNNRWYHMGIVSFGEANCDTEIASVFAKVSHLRNFIDSTIENFS
nr:chymotrypsin B-like [Ciona intestinalis]|eukprot:XP_002124963.1 chymotrypsin B-like [Ciona intestinalis]